MKSFFLFLGIIFCWTVELGLCQAPPIWSLEKCIEEARIHNLRIQQAEIGVEQSGVQYVQSKRNVYPNITGTASYGYNYGFSVNPINNQVVSKGLMSGSYGVNGGMNLYAGGQVQHSIYQNQLNIEAGKSDIAQAERDIALSVAQAYLQVLLSRELIKNTETQLSSTRAQLERAEKLIKAGVAAEATRYTLDAQLASEEINILNAQNQESLAMLSLRQLMNILPEVEFRLASLDLSGYTPVLDTYDLGQTFREAEAAQPSIRSSDIRVQSAKVGVALAEAARKPSLSAFAQVNTRNSSVAQRATGEITYVTSPIQINGQTVEVGSPQPLFEKTPFFAQLVNNIGLGAGLSLTVPIYSRGQNLTNIQLQELNVKSNQMGAAIQRQTLRQNIDRAYWDVQISYNNYLATLKQIEALQKALGVVEKQLNLGTGNQTDFIVSKNNLNRAETDILRAKYDFLFKSKVLEFYRNGTIELK